jgi:hypothetical protein
MKKVLFLIAALFVFTGYAEIRTKNEMYNEINTKFADNSVGGITPAILRSVVTDMFDTSKWRSFTTLNSNTTIDQGIHNGIIADDSLSSLVFTLPDSTANNGAIFGFLKSSSTTNTVTISAAGSDTINGVASIVLDILGESVTIMSNGAGKWWITNTNSSAFSAIQLDTSKPTLPAYVAGQLSYDPDCKVLTADTGFTDVRTQIGLENYFLVYNDSGSTILNGKPVYASGVDSTFKTLTVGLADASSFFTSAQTLGLATSDIPNLSLGLITSFGAVRDFDTSAFSEGGLIYLDVTPGGLTATRPVHPNQVIIIGSVIDSNVSTGVAQVAVDNITKPLAVKSYSFTSQGVGAGEYYIGGFYYTPAADANLDQGSTTVSYGSTNSAYNAHAFVVPSGPGSVDAGQVGLRVNGTMFDEETGVLSSGSGIITQDITTMTASLYAETVEKFVGPVQYELYIVSGTPTTYSLDFNYGLSKYEDFGNNDFTLSGIEVVGLGNAADSDFNVEVLFHKATGWTYSATAFQPGNGTIASMIDDIGPYNQTYNGQNFAWKRTNLNVFIDANGPDGVLYRVTTGNSNTVHVMDLHISGFLEE